jgi:membrane protein implicated in regulation of membrane protease activity
VPDWVLTLGSLIAALLLTRLATPLLRPFFRALKKDTEQHVPVVGRTGIVRTRELTDSHGQIEVPDSNGPMLLNARLKPGMPPLKKGDEVIVFEHDPNHSLYYVKALALQNPIS